MTNAVRVRTASGWQDVAIQGPQGPGGLLDARRIWGTYAGYQGPFSPTTAAQLWCDAAGTVPLRLTYTPPVDCWWDVTFQMALVQKLDAAYHYGIASLALSPNDVDGSLGGTSYIMQHASVQQFEAHHIRRLYKLAANVSYTINALFAVSAGSWQWHSGPDQLWMDARAWPRNVPVANPLAPPLVTTLPASPLDGQEVYFLADATAGIIWHLRYRAASSSAYKWETISDGAPLYAFSATGPVTSVTGTTALAGGPSVVAPRSGEYMLSWGMRGDNQSAGGGWFECRPMIGAAAVVVDDSITQFVSGSGSTNPSGGSKLQRRKIVASAGDTIRLGGNTSGISVSFTRLELDLSPVRLA